MSWTEGKEKNNSSFILTTLSQLRKLCMIEYINGEFYFCVSVHRSLGQIKHQLDAETQFRPWYGDVMTYLQL